MFVSSRIHENPGVVIFLDKVHCCIPVAGKKEPTLYIILIKPIEKLSLRDIGYDKD
ncbi:MAG TPA: hypothetical protein VGD14_00690 [bacterium]